MIKGKTLKKIVGLLMVITFLLVLAPFSEITSAGTVHDVNLFVHSISSDMNETREYINVTMEVDENTTYADVYQYAAGNNLIPTIANIEGVQFVEWEVPRADEKIMRTYTDQNGKVQISFESVEIYAKYDKTYVSWHISGGNAFGHFYDNSATVGVVADYICNNDIDNSIINPVLTPTNGSNVSDPIESASGFIYKYVSFDLSADNNCLIVQKNYDSEDWEGPKRGYVTWGGWDQSDRRSYQIVPVNDGDTYADVANKLSAPPILPGKDDIEFEQWLFYDDINNGGNLVNQNAEITGKIAYANASYNYRLVCVRLLSNENYPEGSYSLFNFYGNIGVGGPGPEWGAGYINIWIPNSMEFTLDNIAKMLPKNWSDTIKYCFGSDWEKDISPVMYCPGNILTFNVYKAYHSSDWETIWAGEYVFPDSKGEDDGGSTYEPVRPSDAQVQEVVAQIEELENIATDANKESLTIDMKQDDGSIATVVPVEILEQIKGKNIEVTLDMGAYSWTINGKNVTADILKDINLEVNIGNRNYWPDSYNDKYSQEWLDMVRGSNPYLCMSLTYDGEFGFEASLNVNVGSSYSGRFGNLYYFNDGFLEFISASKIDANGNASLAFTHASDYAIVISDEASVTPNDTPANTSPDTGDHSHLGIYTLVAVIAVAGITSTIIYKKKAFEK